MRLSRLRFNPLPAALFILLAARVSTASPESSSGKGDWQKPQGIARSLGISEGSTVATIGPGAAYLFPFLAHEVGPSGKLLIADSDPAVVQHFERTIEKEGWRNVTAVLVDIHSPQLPHPADMVLLVNTYRTLDKRATFFKAVKKDLRKNGRVVVIDFYRRLMRVGPPLRERVASHRAMKEIRSFGYKLVRRHNILPYQYFLVYEPR